MESILFALNTVAIVIAVFFSVRDDARGAGRRSSGPFRYTLGRREAAASKTLAERMREGVRR